GTAGEGYLSPLDEQTPWWKPDSFNNRPSQGLPHFVMLVDVDDHVLLHYDRETGKMQPRVSWIEKLKEDDPEFWDKVFKELSAPSSFSSTFHTLKRLRVNSSDVVSADPPVVTVTRRVEAEDEKETHICRVHGFYPRVVNASWTRDGEVWLQDTLHGSVAPNADATYHYWLSIQIDPKERGRYKCHVEHDGLQEPLDVALKDEGQVNAVSDVGHVHDVAQAQGHHLPVLRTVQNHNNRFYRTCPNR
uniref:Ig-like domain-containing protein n=1 Tax=Pseudonaja textilis TaxID=8673 RepID=A0A670ZNL2_PSETE